MSSFPEEKDRLQRQIVCAVISIVIIIVLPVVVGIVLFIAKDPYLQCVGVCRGRMSRVNVDAENDRCTLLRFVMTMAALEVVIEAAASMTETATRQLIVRLIS